MTSQNTPNKPLYSGDYATCSKCDLYQSKDKMEQTVKLRRLKPGREGDLVRDGAAFRRAPATPAETYSMAEIAARDASPWVCTDGDRCALNRIARAVAKFEDNPPWKDGHPSQRLELHLKKSPKIDWGSVGQTKRKGRVGKKSKKK